MKFYFTDYYELDDEQIDEILDGLRQGIDFEALFEDFVGSYPQHYLIYDQVKEFIERLLRETEK